MRKLTKKALSLMLCLMLVVSAISGALSISAEGEPSGALFNFDFSAGTLCWTKADRLDIKDGEVTFNKVTSSYVINTFNLPNLEVGDKVSYSFVIKNLNPEALAGLDSGKREVFRVCLGTPSNTHASYKSANVDANGIFTNTTSGNTYLLDYTVTDPDATLQIQFNMMNSMPGAISLSDMKVIVTKANGKSYIYTRGTTPVEAYFDGNPVGGTEADGYTTKQAGAVLKYPALEAPTNLDFSEGLKYWAPYMENNSAVTSASTYASVDANGILTLTRVDNTTQWKQGISSQKFALPNIAVGDKVRFYFEYDWEDENGKIRDFQARVKAYDATGKATSVGEHNYLDNGNYKTKAPGELSDTGWRTDNFTYTVTDASAVYNISFFHYCYNSSAQNVDEDIQIRNIHVFKVLSDGAYLDLATGEKMSADMQPFGGTEEDGIVNKAYEGSYRDYQLAATAKRTKDIFGTTTNLVNGDFSQGFKYWFGGNYNSSYPELLGLSDYATVDKETGIVKLSAVSGYNPALISMPFYIEGISAGDVLVVAADARNGYTKDGSNGIQLNIWELKNHDTSDQWYNVQTTVNSNFFTAPSDTEWTTIYNNPLTVTDPSHPFMVRAGKHINDATEFKNIRIYKIDPSTGEVALVNYGYDENSNLNKDGGSEENGMIEFGNYVQATPAVDKLTNLDFSQGLKYWALKKGSTGFASDIAEIQPDGSLTITAGATDGIQTAPIVFGDEWAGKEVTLWFHANTDAYNIERSYFADGTQSANLVNRGIGWYGITIPSVVAGTKYNFQIKLSGAGYANISGLKLLSPVAHNNTILSYVDLDGNEFFGSGFDFQPYGGTEDGIILPSNGAGIIDGSYWNNTRNNMPTNDKGFLNGDFSEGFKYWSTKNIGVLPAEQFLLNEGLVTFNPAYDFTGNKYAGLYSQTFTVGNYGLKVGDTFFVEADVTNTPASMAIKLASVYYDENEAGGVANYHLNNGTSAGSGKVAEGSWVTMRASATVKEINEQFTVSIEKQYEGGGGSFKNVRLSKLDKGGMKKFNATSGQLEDVIIRVNIDGSLQANQLLGDANNDGKIDITDIVRMKKEAAGNNELGIFFAAVDIDANGTIEAADLTKVIAKVLDPAYNLVITKK